LFPRVDQSFLPGTAVCWGDVPSKAVPERINSVALTFTAPVTCSIRGGFCASDRNDLPRGLPEHLRPVGLWCIGACSERDRLIPVSFAGVSLTFRYDHTKLVATDRKLRLYRYDGNAWIQVGTGLPGGGNRIATDTALAAVASGEYNIGWFALLAAETNGTVLSIF